MAVKRVGPPGVPVADVFDLSGKRDKSVEVERTHNAPAEVDTPAAPLGDNRPSRYIEVDADGVQTVVYRASSLGGCLRAYVAMATGEYAEPTPDWMQEVFNEGHVAEPLIRDRFREQYDCEVVDDQGEVELDLGDIAGKHVIVRGHHDGIAIDHAKRAGKRGLFEAKKFRESTWPKFLSQGIECNVNYPWQAAVYMHALEVEEGYFVGGRVSFDEWGNLILEEIDVKYIPHPPFSFAAIRKRVASIEKIIAAGFAPMEVDCNNAQYPCPYYKLHDPAPDELILPDVPGVRAQLYAYIAADKASKAADKAAKEAKKAKDEASQAIRDIIEGLGPDAIAAKKIVSDAAGITLTRVRAEVPPATREVKGYSTDYFKITTTKETGEDKT